MSRCLPPNSGPAPRPDMVSRRRILSRSRDDLNLDGYVEEPEEDIWYHKEKLFKEHIQEVLDKWTQIDDEIWAKVIVLERNRRVAKAYARAPVLTINGSVDGFDGFRIGLCGFDNPMRDPKTEEVKRHIGHGVKVKMDDQGNILIKRVSKSNVYVKPTGEESAVSSEVLKLPAGALEAEKPVKIFDMKKFQQNVSRELKRAYPDRRKLECQCISAIAFVKNEADVLDCPVWVMIINVVAMDMIKTKVPPVKRVVDMRTRPRLPAPDEDPYSVAGSGSSGSSGHGPRGDSRRPDKPPKLPPRDAGPYPHDIPKPDYDDIEEENRFKAFASSRGKDKKDKKYDDPYYCGLRARIPNFAKMKTKEEQQLQQQQQQRRFPPSVPGHPMMWHSRSYDSGMASTNSSQHEGKVPLNKLPYPWVAAPPHNNNNDSEIVESPYNHIYGRLPLPNRAYIPQPKRTIYVGEWD